MMPFPIQPAAAHSNEPNFRMAVFALAKMVKNVPLKNRVILLMMPMPCPMFVMSVNQLSLSMASGTITAAATVAKAAKMAKPAPMAATIFKMVLAVSGFSFAHVPSRVDMMSIHSTAKRISFCMLSPTATMKLVNEPVAESHRLVTVPSVALTRCCNDA